MTTGESAEARAARELMQRDDRIRWWHALQKLLIQDAFGSGEAFEEMKLQRVSVDAPKYATGIDEVDEMTRGGLSRLAVVAGKEKLGKSLVVLKIGLKAAEAGWRVFHVDGENAPGIMLERLQNYFKTPIEENRWPEWMFELWTPVQMRSGANVEKLASYVSARISEFDDRLLIIVDSANRLAKRMKARTRRLDYWDALQQVIEWSDNVSTLSNGRASVLLISEMNQRGDAKGDELRYAADQLLYMRKGSQKRRVKLELVARGSDGDELGEFVRVYEDVRFEKAVKLHVVRDPSESAPEGLFDDPDWKEEANPF